MKIVLAGSSGAGKSTLARWISENYDLPYKENSAGMIMLPSDKENLRIRYGYNGDLGQEGVLKLCQKDPGFGLAFQLAVLKAREALAEREKFIYDRSALDPAVFFLHQVGENWNEETNVQVLHECAKVLSRYDLIIYLPLISIDREFHNIQIEREANGGRFAHKFFQWKIDQLFLSTYKLLVHMNIMYGWHLPMPPLSEIRFWNWHIRTSQAAGLIERLKNKIPQGTI